MLLLMNILRSRYRYRGVIYFHPAEADSPPEIEFSDAEGPEQVMNQIQDFAVPEIRKSIEPLGPYLCWEELDLEAKVVRRHRSRFQDRFDFVLCPDELGIELILPTVGNERDAARGDCEQTRPWVPLRPLAEPGEAHLAAIGWSVESPEFQWRYLQTRYAPPTIEMTWSCASLPAHWASQILAGAKLLDCRFGDDKRCPMNPTRDGLLVYRGFYPLPDGSERPASLPVRLRQPLTVTGPEAMLNGAERHGDERLEGERHVLDRDVPATVRALDFRAVISGRSTRLVARADLEQQFEAEVLTAEDVLLPELIPAGAIPGLPWPLEATSAGIEKHDGEDRGTASETGGNDEATRHRWRLAPSPQDRTQGRWQDVAWEHDPPSLGFGLGSFDASRAPRITHIENRRASVAWRMEASDEGGNMCLCVPYWVPVGCPGQAALPSHGPSPSRRGPTHTTSLHNGFDYAAEVRANLDGLEERFVIDQRSEVSFNRLFLGPRRWRFRDEENGAITDGEALGAGAGCVRWRRSTGDVSEGTQPETSKWSPANASPDLKPTDWAGGSAPVLLLRKDMENTLHWGGLYAPQTVPWDAIEELPAEPTPTPDEVLLVPRSPAIWIDLWGFVCRYDAQRVSFTHSHGEDSEPTAWIARTGLELFPRQSGYLLRSFSPIYAVRSAEPRIFSLRLTAPRPTLHLGHELDAESGPKGGLALEIGAETYVRYQLTAPGRLPDSFEPGRVPGTRLRLDRIGRQVVWLAVEQRQGEAGRRAGYLLSWDATQGWLFRGFFAHPGAAAELGMVRQGTQHRRIFLGGEGTSRVSAFHLTIDRQGARWSETAPEAMISRVTVDMIRTWETDHFAPARRPASLQNFGMRILQQAAGDEPWIFEFFDGTSQTDADLPAGIRVWELHGEPDDELVSGARELGKDSDTEEIEIQAPPIEKRILGLDDDEDEF